MDGVRLRAETARHRARRASVRRPDGLAVAVNRDAVGAAPRASFDVRPIAYDSIGVGAAIDGLNLVGLRCAAACLRLDVRSVQCNQDERNHRGERRHHIHWFEYSPHTSLRCFHSPRPPCEFYTRHAGFGITIRAISMQPTRRDFLKTTAGAYAAAAFGAAPQGSGTSDPTHNDLTGLSLWDAGELLQSRKLSPVELTNACLARIA